MEGAGEKTGIRISPEPIVALRRLAIKAGRGPGK